MTADLTWSKAGTHCPWCDKPESDYHSGIGVGCAAIKARGDGLIGRLAIAEELRATIEAQAELLREVALSGVEFDDSRLKYVVVQIIRANWDELQAGYGEVVRADG